MRKSIDVSLGFRYIPKMGYDRLERRLGECSKSETRSLAPARVYRRLASGDRDEHVESDDFPRKIDIRTTVRRVKYIFRFVTSQQQQPRRQRRERTTLRAHRSTRTQHTCTNTTHTRGIRRPPPPSRFYFQRPLAMTTGGYNIGRACESFRIRTCAGTLSRSVNACIL